MRRLLTLALALGLMVSMAYAHGGMEHVMGTIASISATSITVTTTEGKSQTVLLTAETKYAKNNTAITVKDIKAGDSVVIHATRKNNELTAATVKVGVRHMQGDMGSMKMDSSTASQQPK
jgi:Cu/Ag efflux protein CusF